MTKIVNTINRMIDLKLNKIVESMICKIISFDNQLMRADVQPLMQHVGEDGTLTDYGIIAGIPVEFIHAGGFYIRPDYKKDDLVSVKFYRYDNGESLSGNKGLDDSLIFNAANCSVSGGISLENWTAPDNFSQSGLLIGSIDGKLYLNFQADGNLIGHGTQFNWDGKGAIGTGSQQPMVLGNTTATTLSNIMTQLSNLLTALTALATALTTGTLPSMAAGGGALTTALIPIISSVASISSTIDQIKAQDGTVS